MNPIFHHSASIIKKLLVPQVVIDQKLCNIKMVDN